MEGWRNDLLVIKVPDMSLNVDAATTAAATLLEQITTLRAAAPGDPHLLAAEGATRQAMAELREAKGIIIPPTPDATASS